MIRPVAVHECKADGGEANRKCVMCSSGIGHGPQLRIFDGESGTYRNADGDRCTARWATTGTDHLEGDICGRPATEEAADFLLCEHHHKRLLKWVNDLTCNLPAALEVTRKVHLEQVRLDRERAAQQQEHFKEQMKLQADLERERVAAAEAAEAARSVVYYVQRMSDDLIKIGTSRRIAQRLMTHKAAHGHLRLLALHSGTHKEEHEIHRKFAALRVEGEWFRPELPLIDHIAWVRKTDLMRSKDLPECVHAEEVRVMLRRLKRQAKEARKNESAA